MPETTSKPFLRAYVIDITRHHMVRSIDISIAKTMARISEAESNPEMAREILLTLSDLNSMKNALMGEGV